MPLLKEIIEDWLKDHGYSGLFCPECGCGCELGDLLPGCDCIHEDCEAGYWL